MQYEDDPAIEAGCTLELQEKLSLINAQFLRVSLMMNIDKTELMHNLNVEQPIYIRNSVINEAHEFTSLELSSRTTAPWREKPIIE